MSDHWRVNRGVSRNVPQLHDEQVIPPIHRSGERVEHAFLLSCLAGLARVRTGKMPVRTQGRHHPGVEKLDVGAALDSVEQVPLVDDSDGVVVEGRELAPPVPEGAVDDAGAVLGVAVVNPVGGAAILVARDGGPEHDNVLGLRKMASRVDMEYEKICERYHIERGKCHNLNSPCWHSRRPSRRSSRRNSESLRCTPASRRPSGSRC